MSTTTDHSVHAHDGTYVPVADIYKSYIDHRVDDEEDPEAAIADEYDLSEEAVEGAIRYAEKHAPEAVHGQVCERILEEKNEAKREVGFYETDRSLPHPEKRQLRVAIDRSYEKFRVADEQLLG